MIKASVRIENIAGLDAQFAEVIAAIEANEEIVAGVVESEAKSSLLFADKSGKLRKSIGQRKGKQGGYIVFARAPHAHLVEFGHVMLNKFGKRTKLGRVKAHPFLRQAKEAGIIRAVELFRSKK